MDITITPSRLCGSIEAIPSKSQAHRLLICAAFADRESLLICPETNQDIQATVNCLNALGAQIQPFENGYLVKPICNIPSCAVLPCSESGSTLRFMLPIAGALGVDATFLLEGRLPLRPLSPLWEEMERMGCSLSRPQENAVRCTGKLLSGTYSISGKVSSQFITGLLFALSLTDGRSVLKITDTLESKPYVDMTLDALHRFGVVTDGKNVVGSFPFQSPGTLAVEGDWSNSAFYLSATAIGNDVSVAGLNTNSFQGDRVVTELLKELADHITVSAKDIPDLIPILSVVAAAGKGAVFTDIQRLRLKESDRVASVVDMLCSLGISASADESTLYVSSGRFHGGIIDSKNDHRIAMSAAIAATLADSPVTIKNAQCVAKSYPKFWQDYRSLGGKYE